MTMEYQNVHHGEQTQETWFFGRRGSTSAVPVCPAAREASSAAAATGPAEQSAAQLGAADVGDRPPDGERVVAAGGKAGAGIVLYSVAKLGPERWIWATWNDGVRQLSEQKDP